MLRDSFGLAAAGTSAAFSTIAAGVLRGLFTQHAPDRDGDAAVQHVLDGFTSLRVHPDVPAGVHALADGGLRLVTLNNGATSFADTLLTGAGVRDRFERLPSVEAAGRWKPAPESYAYAARECNEPPEQMLLVAVHLLVREDQGFRPLASIPVGGQFCNAASAALAASRPWAIAAATVAGPVSASPTTQIRSATGWLDQINAVSRS